MTSFTESVEIVEVTWKIPNFDQFIPSSPSYSEQNVPDFRKVVFIVGRLPPAYPQSKWPPVKLEVSVSNEAYKYGLHSMWRFEFVTISDASQPPSPCTYRGKFLGFKILDGECEHTFAESRESKRRLQKWVVTVVIFNTYYPRMKVIDLGESMDLGEPKKGVILFDTTDAEKCVDKRDGSLNIYFKMEIKCSCSEPNGGMEFTEMLGGFESLLKNPTHSDVEIKVTRGEGRTFQGHKIILAGRSEVFRAMFQSRKIEAYGNVVEVDDILPKTMEHFLSFVYCGRFQDSSWIRSLPQLAYAADKYCVKSLQNICDLHLVLNVTAENALTLRLLARRYGLMKAAEDIWAFCLQNLLAVNLDTDLDTSNSDVNFSVRYSVPTGLLN